MLPAPRAHQRRGPRPPVRRRRALPRLLHQLLQLLVARDQRFLPAGTHTLAQDGAPGAAEVRTADLNHYGRDGRATPQPCAANTWGMRCVAQ